MGLAAGTTGCGNDNLSLLSSWSGTPSASAPAGAAFRAHLAQLAGAG